IAAFVKQRTGWPIEMPRELAEFAPVAEGAMSEGPPPGLGFVAHQQEDGSLRLVRRSSSAGWGMALLAMGVFFGLCALVWAVEDVRKGGSQGAAGLALFALLALGLAAAGIRPAFAREEWLVGRGMLEVRECGLGSVQAERYLDGSLALTRLSDKEGET